MVECHIPFLGHCDPCIKNYMSRAYLLYCLKKESQGQCVDASWDVPFTVDWPQSLVSIFSKTYNLSKIAIYKLYLEVEILGLDIRDW